MNSAKPDISIFASAHRPQNWMSLYKSIGENKVKFEIIFVGPNPPNYGLPENFRFIKSNVKPAQCAEIAARHTTADLIMDMADDFDFRTPQPLDKLYELYKSHGDERIIVSSKVMTNGEDQSYFAHNYYSSDGHCFVMALCGLMSRKLYFNLGGIDKKFIAIMWPLDIAMRVYAAGGTVVLSDVYLNEDRSKCAGSNLCNEFWNHDRVLLENLWKIDGKFRSKRSKPVESFSNLNILDASQGPRGRWRGSLPLFLEKAQDGILKCKLVLEKAGRGIRKPSMYANYAQRIISRLNVKS